MSTRDTFDARARQLTKTLLEGAERAPAQQPTTRAPGSHWRALAAFAVIAVAIAGAILLATGALRGTSRGTPAPATHHSPSPSPVRSSLPIDGFIAAADSVCVNGGVRQPPPDFPAGTGNMADPNPGKVLGMAPYWVDLAYNFQYEDAKLHALALPPSRVSTWTKALAAYDIFAADTQRVATAAQSGSTAAYHAAFVPWNDADTPVLTEFNAFGAKLCGGTIPSNPPRLSFSPGPSSLTASGLVDNGRVLIAKPVMYGLSYSGACLQRYAFYFVDLSTQTTYGPYNSADDFVGSYTLGLGTWQGKWFVKNEPPTPQYAVVCTAWTLKVTPEPGY
jgi:hypothetical protein